MGERVSLWPPTNFEASQLQQEGHMGTNYDHFPENASKFQQSLNYTSCDELIKNRPFEVGLKYYFFQCKFAELHLSRRK